MKERSDRKFDASNRRSVEETNLQLGELDLNLIQFIDGLVESLPKSDGSFRPVEEMENASASRRSQIE